MTDAHTRMAATFEKQLKESKMPKTERTRIDYMPSQAALEALSLAAERFPELRPQALLDKLVICGLSALAHKPWHAPHLYGKDRDRWRLPDDLRPG